MQSRLHRHCSWASLLVPLPLLGLPGHIWWPCDPLQEHLHIYFTASITTIVNQLWCCLYLMSLILTSPSQDCKCHEDKDLVGRRLLTLQHLARYLAQSWWSRVLVFDVIGRRFPFPVFIQNHRGYCLFVSYPADGYQAAFWFLNLCRRFQKAPPKMTQASILLPFKIYTLLLPRENVWSLGVR